MFTLAEIVWTRGPHRSMIARPNRSLRRRLFAQTQPLSTRSPPVEPHKMITDPRSRGFLRRLRAARIEAQSSPPLVGLAAGVSWAAVARVSGYEWRKAASLGLAGGALQGGLLAKD